MHSTGMARRRFVHLLAWGSVGGPWLRQMALGATEAKTNEPPNVALVLCHNLGYGDVGCYNPAAKQRTPNIDRMAAEECSYLA